MKELSPWQNIVFRVGALLMLVGIGINVVSPLVSFLVYTLGAIAFSLMKLKMEYLGSDFVVMRLRRQQLLACAFYVLAAVCMSMQVLQYGMARRNEWVVALTVACVLEVYTAWRIPSALSKSKKS